MAGRMLFAWMRDVTTRNARMAADDALHADAETIEITFAQKKEPYSQRFFRASDARSFPPAVSKALL